MRFPIALASLVLALAVHAQEKKADAPKDKDFDLPKSWVMDVLVVDKASGEPIPGLTMSVRADQQTRAYATDERGHAAVDYVEGLRYLNLRIKAPGFVEEYITWSGPETKKIPDTFKIELERGTSIGGKVTNEAGKPIAGADVSILYQRRNDPLGKRMNFYMSAKARTDGQGKWRSDVLPAEAINMSIRLSHPDYLSDTGFDYSGATASQLRDMTAVNVMKKGVALTGRVIDTQGKPIAGARITHGDRGGSNAPEAKSDAQGKFRFAQSRPGATVLLTATATGYSPHVISVPVGEDGFDAEIKLEPGHVLKGRVVDVKGDPVPKVWIAPEQWRGNRMLPLTRDRIETGNDGRFVWNEAPADEVRFSILKQGYLSTREVPLKADEQEHVIKLLPELHVIGTVVDAQTGKPVEKFKAIHGIDWGDRGGGRQPIYWETNQPVVAGSDGKFEFDINEMRAGHAIRIEADDYLPAESRIFKDEEMTVSLEFKLKKGAPLAGTIRTPDGKPVAGAGVVLRTTGRSSYMIRNGELAQSNNALEVRTDEQGHYSMPPQIGKFGLIVLHPSGYAEVSPEQLAKSADVTIAPWGKVQGVLKVGAKPGVARDINVSSLNGRDDGLNSIYHDLKATTDAEGRFAVDRVPPGRTQVSLVTPSNDPFRGGAYAQTRIVEVKAGETIEVNIGGTGRPVIGRVDVPAGFKEKIVWAQTQGTIGTRADYRPPRLPENYDQMDQAARAKVHEESNQSPEYQTYLKAVQNTRHFGVKMNDDGSFRAEDIPAGSYMFNVSINEPGGNFRAYGDPIGFANKDFTIDEMPGGRSDEPLDLGAIALKPYSRLKVGNPAPELSAQSLDGKPISLNDFKGKYVIVHFWNVIYRPTPDDLPDLKAAHAAVEKDPRVVMLSVSLDQRIEWAKRFAAKNELRWIQAHVEESAHQDLVRAWSWRSDPIFIISPEGKILAAEIKPANLKSTLEKLLPPL